MINKSPLRWIS